MLFFFFRKYTWALTFENAGEAELWLLVAKGASYGHQNTKSPLFAITVGSAAHLVLDWVLIGTHSEKVFLFLFFVYGDFLWSIYLDADFSELLTFSKVFSVASLYG